MHTVTLTYFAAAKAAAQGTATQEFQAETIAQALKAAAQQHGAEFERVLGLCSFLVNGARATEDALAMPLQGDTRVDVLPPFAGG